MGRGEAAVLTAALIWGVAFLFQKTAMGHVGPLTFVAGRCVIAALVLAPFAVLEGRGRSLPAGFWPKAGLTGLVFLLAGGLQQAGIVTTTVANTSFLTALYVVFVPFLSWAVMGGAPSPAIWVGAGLALAGTLGLAGGRLDAFGGGDWLVIASALFWAVHMLVSERAARLDRPLAFTAACFAVTATLALPLALIVEGPQPADLFAAAPQFLFVGVMSSAVTYFLFNLSLRYISGPRAAVLLASEAVFAALAAAVFLGERLAPSGWLGAGLIFAAVLAVQLRGAAR